MHEEWTDRLSDYLDDELSPAERRDVESHLQACESCRAVLDELARVVSRAQGLVARPPHSDLWGGIDARIEAERATPFIGVRRRIAFTVPQLAAAAVFIAIVSGGLVARLMAPSGNLRIAPEMKTYTAAAPPAEPLVDTSVARPPIEATTPAVRRGDQVEVNTVSFADAQYDAAVTDLEAALKKGRGRLDATTIAIVEQNLQIIDQAIAQAREALAADPANSYLSGHLVDARRRKLDLLRHAASLTSD
jgi:anti-sigma factor RsiW